MARVVHAAAADAEHARAPRRNSSRATRRTRAHSPARAAGIEQAAQGVKRERAEVCSAGSRGAMSRARAPRSPTQHYSAAQLLRHVDDPLESADARAVGTEHAEHAHGARGARRGGETMARVVRAAAARSRASRRYTRA
ncbi:hypothetical protein GGX14DRAFT_559655 [Mycena pura]|uniref:Uncharacterized protein n=1 Tax=Mycena pura TaxID=153505 RepID=A0AAD6YK35_9AGAR|nr:hypothetical protein GGX14DRAFT_559655 [Mycena pura]